MGKSVWTAGSELSLPLVLMGIAGFWPPPVLGTLPIDPESGNISLSDDIFSHNAPPDKIAVGDFDGNGIDDVAFGRPESREIVVLLNSPEGPSLLSEATLVRIKIKNMLSDFTFADLNGDKKKDLVIGTGPLEINNANPVPYPGQVDVVFWDPGLPSTVLDLTGSSPGVRIVGNAGNLLGKPLVAGDFVGDNTEDLFIGSIGIDGGYLLEGRKGLAPVTLDLAGGASLPHIVGAGVGVWFWTSLESIKGDFNGDGDDDLVIKCHSADFGRGYINGDIFIVFGRLSFLSPVLTLGSYSKVARVRGAGNFGAISVLAAGDVTNDGNDDLIIGPRITSSLSSNTFARPVYLLKGDALSEGDIVDLAVDNTTKLTPDDMNVNQRSVQATDFDGDGIKDVVFLTMDNGGSWLNLLGRLSSDGGDEAFKYTGPENWSFQWSGNWSSLSSGEFRGDAPRDLVVYEVAQHGPPFGKFQFLFGFAPLKNPTLDIRDRAPVGPRVTLDLGVSGNPTEVLFEGDVNPAFLGRWWPYQKVFPLDLSSPLGPKTVRARFRNRVGQKSDLVSDRVTMSLGSVGSEVVANLLTPGETVRVDCHLESPARVEAEVFNREGSSIRPLLDEEWGTGVWPVLWDGKNSAGQPVAPGMYVLIIKVNGHGETHKILVQ